MRLERDYGWDGASVMRTLNHGLHDQLMSQVQPVKHTQCQDRRAGDLSIVGSVEKSHLFRVQASACRFPKGAT